MEDVRSQLQAWSESFAKTAATFIDEQPLLASVAAVVLVAFVLYLVSKLARVAMVGVFVIALLVGIVVYTVGPDRARSYLDQLTDGAAAAERDR